MLRTVLLAFSALCVTLLLAFSALNTPSKISPQGCRMSYMSPSYVLQTGFNASWTSASLANRYKLMLYREVGWDSNDELQGVPVLFIPGNAGSAHQVRSIASSATRQYYSSPLQKELYFMSRGLRPLDVFSVDFNEDLSAFHGPTLESEHQYTAAAIDYILSLYPTGTQIIVMGHSMGGIVATALLPSSDISAIITMSTPHGAPPARFDARMDRIFAEVTAHVFHDPTPILSVCGGVTDTMIPSEFCTLPSLSEEGVGFRKTVFSSALEGCWTGVGHKEMVWCHQIRWRVARAVLELAGARTLEEKIHILNEWFRVGNELILLDSTGIEPDWNNFEDAAVESIPEGSSLLVQTPWGTQNYNFAISHGSDPRRFVLYLSGGTILSVSPANPLSLKASVHLCRRSSEADVAFEKPVCELLAPSSLKVIPNPTLGRLFPAPSEGVDESDGVVAFSAPIHSSDVNDVREEWISLRVENGDRRGWFAAVLETGHEHIHDIVALVPVFGSVNVQLDPKTLHSVIRLSRLLSNVLLVYRVVPQFSHPCENALLSPLLLHTSGPFEGHYHRLEDGKPILLQDHSSAPFLSDPLRLSRSYSRGLNITVYSSGECGVEGLNITVDRWNSFARWGPRYWNTILAWSSGVVAFMFYSSWTVWDSGGMFRKAKSEAPNTVVYSFYADAVAEFEVQFPTSPSSYGEPIFAPIAPFLLFLSCGLVALSWVLLLVLMTPYGWVLSKFSRAEDDNAKEGNVSHRGGLLTILIMSLLVFLLIPWQVAFLACYLIHFHHCSILLYAREITLEQHDARNQKLLVLIMMTWCLPVVAPVLAVWVRTLMTAGLTTPFDGDHFVLNALSFMSLTYAMTTVRGPVFLRKHRFEFIPVPYVYAFGALVVFLVGPRATYRMYEVLNWPTFGLLCFRAALRFFPVSGQQPHDSRKEHASGLRAT